MNKNNIRYYALSISSFVLFHIPILTIYFNNILDSVTLVSFLFFIKSITVLIFEIPTGYIADRYSRKLSLLIGKLLNILTLILFIYNPNFYSLLIAEFCFGLSECLLSGADEAFYYDNFKSEEQQDYYSKFVQNIGLIQSIFLSIAFFIGSILYGYNNKIVFIISIVFQIISLIILLTIHEYPYKKESTCKFNIKNEIKICKQYFKTSMFYLLLLYSLILAMFLSIYLQLFPIVSSSLSNNYYLYGSIYVFAMLTYGIGAKKGSDNINNLPKLLIILLFTMLIGIIFKNNIYIILLVIITRFIWGYINTGLNIYINKNTSDSTFRATIFSILSMLTNLFSSLFMFLMGLIIDSHIGLETLFIIWSFIIIILLILSKKILLKGGELNDLQQTNM